MILTYVTVTKAHKKALEQSILKKSVLYFNAALKKKKGLIYSLNKQLGKYGKITWFHEKEGCMMINNVHVQHLTKRKHS